MRRPFTTIVLLAALLGLSGVASAYAQEEPAQNEPTQKEPAQQDPAQEAEPEPQAATEAKPAVVELLEPGVDPQVRRYKITAGDKAMLRMVTDMQMQMDMGTGFEGPKMPANEMYMSMHVRSVDDDGVAKVDCSIERVGVLPAQGIDPFVADAYSQGLAVMRGIMIRSSFDPMGRTTDVFVTNQDGTPITDRQLRSTMEDTAASASLQLPETPIGVGGRWRIIEDIEIGGVRMQRTSTHTLTAIEDGMFHVSSEIEVGMEPHHVDNPDLPPGTRLRMDSTTMAGSSTSVFSLNSAAGSAEVNTSGDIRMTIFQDGVPMKMAQRISMSMKIEPYEGDLPEIDQGSDDAPPF